ncbi:MAG: YkgJ family cysteine cluster protein [Planctomycetes bacterium]|nr:YkgJ family cysteine cluster protein [Planctomycetota bacterium]
MTDISSRDIELARGWMEAVLRAEVAGQIEAIYQIVADQVAERRPVCETSGRCCHFEQHGHRLYVTGLEAAYSVAKLGRPVTMQEVEAARTRGDCPFLSGVLCTIHEIKPLGCRVYYCDPTAQEWQQALSERMLGMIRGVHDRHGVEYRYGEWRGMLAMFAE